MGKPTQISTGSGFVVIAVIVGLIAVVLNCKPDTPSPPVNKAQTAPQALVDTITVITVDNRARLCPQPNCGQGQELLRIPTNTKLPVRGQTTVKNGPMRAVWFKVSYNGKVGWVSQYDTDKAQ